MMFTTPCFVRVKDASAMRKLDIWLDKIGYEWKIDSKSEIKEGRHHVLNEDYVAKSLTVVCRRKTRMWTISCASKRAIDCGTDVELFKALAAMNDDNCREQWFVSDCLLKFERLKGVVKTEHRKRCLCRGEWFKVLIDEARDIRAAWIGFKRPKSIAHCASAEEIIKHFKNRAK